MKKYRTKFSDTIECFEVTKETDKQVLYINPNNNKVYRENKQTSWYKWYDTFDEARQGLINAQLIEIGKSEKHIIYSKEIIERIKLLKENE